MIPAITKNGMLEVDRMMVEDLQINIQLMMEHAGLNLAKLAYNYINQFSLDGAIIVAGSGNNGGGGIVSARRLKNWIDDITIWLPKGKPKREIPKIQLERSKAYGINITYDPPEVANQLVIDAFIGYNFSGRLEGVALQAITFMKQHDVISLDVPSAIDSTTGENIGDLSPLATLTLAWVKTGLLLQKPKHIGSLYLADIGVPCWVFNNQKLYEFNVFPPSATQIKDLYYQFSVSSYIELSFSKDGFLVKNKN